MKALKRHWLLMLAAVAVTTALLVAYVPAHAGYWTWNCDPYGNCWQSYVGDDWSCYYAPWSWGGC